MYSADMEFNFIDKTLHLKVQSCVRKGSNILVNITAIQVGLGYSVPELAQSVQKHTAQLFDRRTQVMQI